MKFWLFSCLLVVAISVNSQCNQFKMYEHFNIIEHNDTINYHAFAPGGLISKQNLLVFIHGSGARPFFEFFTEKGKKYRGSSMPFKVESIPNDYAFVIISKKGIPFCSDSEEEFKASDAYHVNLSLQYRVLQVDKVINDIVKNYIPKPKKIVVIGHSEGSDVVAKLGTLNSKITHIGFWSGSGNSQLYDFPLFIRKDVLQGKLTEEEGLVQMDSLFTQYKAMMNDKDAVDKKWYGHAYKRWVNFSEPPIKNLLQINIPLYVAMGAKDTSVPIESTYLIPVEFIRNGKENLTFKVYPNLDHSFNEQLVDGKKKRHWNNVFVEFMNWVNKN